VPHAGQWLTKRTGAARVHVHIHYLGDYLAAFLHIQHVAFVHVELAHYVLVVHRRAPHHGAAELHRLKVGHRGDSTHAANVERN
jgi:hypothetical protein